MPDHSTPDHPLADTLVLDASQIQVLHDETRLQIVSLLSERAATASQLAEIMGRPKGTIGHHCKSLEEAGLIAVVRTEMVRAVTAKYYGRTARTFLLGGDDDFPAHGMLAEAAREIANSRAAGLVDDLPAMSTIRYARIPTERAAEWEQRLSDLAEEFSAQPRGGRRAFLLSLAIAPTTRPTFPEDDG
jgi:DNA-binding transcriptional ArsR family regulator